MEFAYPELKKRIPETEEEIENDEAMQYFKAHQHRHEKSGDSYLLNVKDLFKIINVKKGNRILDIGCGYGGFISKIDRIKSNLSFVGVDASKAMIKLANKHIKKKNMEFLCQRADRLSFKKEFFDVIICKDTFHHFRSPVMVLKELFRVLKKGGKIYINDLRRDVNKKIVMEVINKLADANLANTQQYIASVRASYTIPEMRNLLKKANIKNYKIIKGNFTKKFAEECGINKKENFDSAANYVNGHWILLINK